MMPSAIGKLKFRHLQRTLDLPEWQIVGILESLWLATGRNAPAGDIGKLTNEEIALAIDWREDADELVEALAKTRWLDKDPVHRLLIHNWPEHCPSWIKGAFKKHGKQFATLNAKLPSTSIADAKQMPSTSLAGATSPDLTSPDLTSPDLTAGAKQVLNTDDPPHPDSEPASSKRKRVPDPLWDAVEEIYQFTPVTKSDKTRMGKIVRDLKALGATPSEIRERRSALVKAWSDTADTPEALVKHWSKFNPEAKSAKVPAWKKQLEQEQESDQ